MPVYAEKELVDGQKRYYVRTYVKDEFGKVKQITRHNKSWIGKDGKKEAEWEDSRLKNGYGEIKKKENEETKNENEITINELKKIYLERKKSKLDEDTLKDKETMLNHFCEIDKTNQVITYPNLEINKLTKQKYYEWQNEMRIKKYKVGKKEKIFSITRLNKIHNEICRMFEFAIDEGLCKQNIPKQCDKIGTLKEIKLCQNQKVYDTISFEEYKKLLAVSVDNKKYNTYFDFVFSRGPRPGEIRAFQVKDFDPIKKQIMVNHTMNKKNKLKEPKTANSKAPIDLDDSLNNKFISLINDLKKQDGFNDEWYIFGKDTPISNNALEEAKNKYFKLAGINHHIRLHDFRHSCATWLFSIGIPITVISKILRHKNIEETLRTYTHLAANDYKNSLEIISNYKADGFKQDQKQDQNLLAK